MTTTTDLHIRFGDCEAGWISMWIGAGDKPLRVACSHVYDPLDDMLVWLEAIVLDKTPARFVVDEEGSTVAFEAIVLPQTAPEPLPTYSLVVTHDYVAPTLQFALSKHVLVSAFYEALTAFGDSDAYLPEAWEYQSIAEKIEQVTGQPYEAWVEHAVLLNRRALQMAIWQFEQQYISKRHADGFSCGTLEELALMVGKDAMPKGVLPWYWPLDEAMWDDGMTDRIEERRAYLLESKDEKVSAYSGYSWRQKRSMLVEQWLAGQPCHAEQGA